MANMLAIQVVENDLSRQGNGLKAVQVPRPTPGPGQALIAVKLRPINPADVFCSMGVYAGFSTERPAITGLEGMGVVEALGPATSGRCPPGTRVGCAIWPLKDGRGTWSEFVCVNEEDLVALPGDVTDQQAAVLSVNPPTVIGMFQDANVKPGDYVVVTAAASAVGRMAIKYGKEIGAKVIGTVRRDTQVAELMALGAAAVINTETEDLTARLLELTGGKGADACFECVLGDVPLKVLNGMAERSTTLIYGALSDINFTAPGVAVLFKLLTIKGFWVAAYMHTRTAEERRAILEKSIEMFQKGVFTAKELKTYPLAEAQAALREQVAGAEGAEGKIFLSS